MKVWRIRWQDDSDSGAMIAWAASKRAAEKALAANLKEAGLTRETGGPCGVEPVEIPTGKAGLLHWLNVWIATDSG